MFNIQGSEMIFLLLIALVVLGPEKLPDAIRKFGRAYSEFKKMANGFQGELREALDEPMRELRDTADLMRSAANFDDPAPTPASTPTTPEIVREPGLNFGSANPRRVQRTNIDDVVADAATADEAVVDTNVRPAGLNFGSANPRRTTAAPRDVSAPVDDTPEAEPPLASDDPEEGPAA